MTPSGAESVLLRPSPVPFGTVPFGTHNSGPSPVPFGTSFGTSKHAKLHLAALIRALAARPGCAAQALTAQQTSHPCTRSHSSRAPSAGPACAHSHLVGLWANCALALKPLGPPSGRATSARPTQASCYAALGFLCPLSKAHRAEGPLERRRGVVRNKGCVQCAAAG